MTGVQTCALPISPDTASKEGLSPRAVFQALLIAGADIDARDEYDNTPLMIATVQNNTGMVELLLDLGANKRAVTKTGRSARDIATNLGHRYLMQLLYYTGKITPLFQYDLR